MNSRLDWLMLSDYYSIYVTNASPKEKQYEPWRWAGVRIVLRKYYDKYSFSTSSSSEIGSKLGDGIKEVYKGTGGWYNDYSYLAYSRYPWFSRGGYYNDAASAGVFYSRNHNGNAGSYLSSRLIITP